MNKENEKRRKEGEAKAFRARAMELMKLWILKLSEERQRDNEAFRLMMEEEKLRLAVEEWERENQLLTSEDPDDNFDWQFQYDNN
jgi:hypothetical protein